MTVRRLFSKQEHRALWTIGEGLIPMSTASGKAVSERSAMMHSVVWAAVTLIADSIAVLTPEAFVASSDDPDQLAKVDLPTWIRSPHPDLQRFDVLSQLIISLLLWGNGYARIVRRPSDQVIVGLLPLDPSRVTCEWKDSTYRRYRIDSGPWLSSNEIFHIQGPTLPGEPSGMSVIRQARESIALGLTFEEFGSRFFGQGSPARIVLELPQKVDDDAVANRIIKTFERWHKGRANWHRPAIASGGAKIHNITIPNEDSQFLESRQHQDVDIARWFKVPPSRVGVLGVTTSWGSGIHEEAESMLKYTFRPWITRLENVFTSYAPGGEDRGIRIRLNTNELVRGSFSSQVESWAKAVAGRIATPNEARKLSV